MQNKMAELIENTKVKYFTKQTKSVPESRVLAFSCLHAPFSKNGYFEFINETYKRYHCNTIVNLGDIADFHSISFHPKDPNLPAPSDELGLIREELKKWYSEYPKMMCCESNHESLPHRQAKANGIPKEMIRDLNEILEAPKGWKWKEQWVIDDVIYKHEGTFCGQQAALNSAKNEMQSMVIGHLHAQFGVMYFANNERCIFGASTGCGVDRRSMALAYGKNFKAKPILGCVIIVNGLEVIPVRWKL